MEPVKIFTACQDDELLFRTRYRNINQLFVVFQPIVGTLVCLVGNAEGKQDNVFFIALKGMDCTAGYIGIAVFTQAFVDKLALIGKRRDNSNFFAAVFGQYNLKPAAPRWVMCF